MAGDASTITLFPNEHIVFTSDQDKLILTNMRVRLSEAGVGGSTLMTIVLDAVASCAVVTRSQPWLIMLGVAAILGALTQTGMLQIGLFAIGAVLIGAFWAMRSEVLSIASTGGTEIVLPVKRIPRETIIEFIDAVEKEKLAFLARLRWAELLPEK